MSEFLPPNPDATGPDFSGLDPSMHAGDPTGTIAEFSAQQLQDIAERMAPDQFFLHQDNMTVAKGETLESQCNKNYAYLNERGISMQQFNGALQAFRDTCQATEGLVTVQRADGGKEMYGHQTMRMLGARNPITGDEPKSYAESIITVKLANQTPDQENLRVFTGINDLEVDVAQHGLFGEPKEGDVSGSCRAEQILKRLLASETGQDILIAQGIGVERPAAPIALVAEAKVIDSTEEPATVEEQPPLISQGKRGLGRLSIFGRRK